MIAILVIEYGKLLSFKRKAEEDNIGNNDFLYASWAAGWSSTDFFFFITGYQVPGSLVGNAPLKNIYQMHTELIKLEMYLLAKHQFQGL